MKKTNPKAIFVLIIIICLLGLAAIFLTGCNESVTVPVAKKPIAALDAESPYGMTSFIPSPARWDAMAEAGIAWHRCDFSWKWVEEKQGAYDWSVFDEMVAHANARGLHIYAGLGYCPKWASTKNQHTGPLNEVGKWAWYNFVYACVTRYKDSIHYWELWNEPNLKHFWAGSRSQYIEDILKVGADAVHAADQAAKVCAPEISTCTGKDCIPETWMHDSLKAAGDKIDIICYHQYDGGDKPQGRLAAIDQMHQNIIDWGYGDKDVWITECGWRSDEKGVDEQKQGEYLVAMLDGIAERSDWCRKFFWYQIWEAEKDGAWGLLYEDETRKPIWYVYRDYIKSKTGK